MPQELVAGPRTLTPQCHPRPAAATANDRVRVFLDSVHWQLSALDTVHQRLQGVPDSRSTQMPLSDSHERGGSSGLSRPWPSHTVWTGSCLTTARSERVGRTGDYFRKFKVDECGKLNLHHPPGTVRPLREVTGYKINIPESTAFLSTKKD